MAKGKLDDWFIAAILKTRRIDLKLKQIEVARAVRMSDDTIRNWENGVSPVPYLAISKLAQFLKIEDETAAFMEDIIDGRDDKNVQANPRLNALILAMAERHFGEIWKWEPEVLPGIVQTRAHNFNLMQAIEGTTDQQAQFGWNFKRTRQGHVTRRNPGYKMNIIIGHSAFDFLRGMSAAERREQIEYVRECAARPGWDIRVMASAHNLGGAYELYLPNGSPSAGPGFVYTEIHDISWCIEERDRVVSYHDRVKKNHPRASPLEEFLDAERDRLA